MKLSGNGQRDAFILVYAFAVKVTFSGDSALDSIDRSNYSSQPSAFKASKDVYILACEHTFIKGVSECDLKCAYGIGNQLGAFVAMQRAYLRSETVSLNKDDTIPIHLLIRNGFKDYTA